MRQLKRKRRADGLSSRGPSPLFMLRVNPSRFKFRETKTPEPILTSVIDVTTLTDRQVIDNPGRHSSEATGSFVLASARCKSQLRPQLGPGPGGGADARTILVGRHDDAPTIWWHRRPLDAQLCWFSLKWRAGALG
jgi:hypothetical protein